MGCPENPLTREWLSVWPPPEAAVMARKASCLKSTNRSPTQNMKFKEGAPLMEYLRQRVPNFGEAYTLREVLTMLKEITRDNLLFDESNPSMIVGDAPLEAALGRREVDVNEIRGVRLRAMHSLREKDVG